MKKVLFSLILIGTLSLGFNLNNPLLTKSPLIKSNIVIAAEDMKMGSDMDMGTQQESAKKDDHDADSKDKQEMSSMSDEEMSNMTDNEMKSHDSGTSHEEKDSKHEEESGGHGGNSEYTPPNKIFLITILTIMVGAMVIASTIRHRRGRVENESIGQ